MAGNHTLATPVVAPRPRHRVAKSLESESASITVILGGLAVVAASVLASGLPSQTPTAEAATAIESVQSSHARYSIYSEDTGATVMPVPQAAAEPAAPVRRSQWWWLPVGGTVAAAVVLLLRRLTRRPVDAPAPNPAESAPNTPSLRPAAVAGR